jgi:hypothetical protein
MEEINEYMLYTLFWGNVNASASRRQVASVSYTSFFNVPSLSMITCACVDSFRQVCLSASCDSLVKHGCYFLYSVPILEKNFRLRHCTLCLRTSRYFDVPVREAQYGVAHLSNCGRRYDTRSAICNQVGSDRCETMTDKSSDDDVNGTKRGR